MQLISELNYLHILLFGNLAIAFVLKYAEHLCSKRLQLRIAVLPTQYIMLEKTQNQELNEQESDM